MASRIEHLALQIAALEADEQRNLWICVADLLYRRGLRALSEQYRDRLKRAGELDASFEEILIRLGETREEIAGGDYPRRADRSGYEYPDIWLAVSLSGTGLRAPPGSARATSRCSSAPGG